MTSIHSDSKGKRKALAGKEERHWQGKEKITGMGRWKHWQGRRKGAGRGGGKELAEEDKNSGKGRKLRGKMWEVSVRKRATTHPWEHFIFFLH